MTKARAVESRTTELRAERPGPGGVIRGVAVYYGSPSSRMVSPDGRRFVERFRAGAFTNALAAGADVRFVVNHDKNLILGRNAAGTLEIIDDPDALRFRGILPQTELARHYGSSVARGDMTGVSFRFYMVRDQWNRRPDGTWIREILEADIDDIAIVTTPAYPDSSASVSGPQAPALKAPLSPQELRKARKHVRGRLMAARERQRDPRRRGE